MSDKSEIIKQIGQSNAEFKERKCHPGMLADALAKATSIQADKTNKAELIESLDQFTKAYIECALWSSNDDDGDAINESFEIEDISVDALIKMRDDCAKFQSENAELLAQAGNDEQNGHDFWLTRNHHGAGYWDRGHGKIGQALTDKAHAFGSCDLFVHAEIRMSP